jgi:hypothetical protein
MKFHPRLLSHPAILSLTVSLLLAGLLYGDVLSLPLFSDDLVQIPWLESVTWRELWTQPSPYGYYRPLWYTIWRIWGRVIGGLHPLGLHLLNLMAHVVATWLTGMLAAAWLRRAASRRERAIAAGLASVFFVMFPFSRQAVAWPGAVYNPLVSAMAAAAVLSYDLGRTRHSISWSGAAFLLATLAAFTYESGILVAPLLVALELFGQLRGRWRTRSWWFLVFIALFLTTLVFWRSLRGVGVVGFGITSADLRHNLAYLLQGLIFPVAPLAERLVRWLSIDPVLAVWLVALPTLPLLLWQAMRRNLEALLLGVGWFGLFAIPPLVSMKAEWFALAPRFLYMTAAGASLIWSAALSTWIGSWRRWLHLAVTGLVVAALLMPAAVFVRRGLELYHMAGRSIWAAAAAAAREHPVLLVNLPRRITPRGRLYPVGFEGVTPLPMRVTADELAYVHTGIHDAAEAVAFGVVATDQPTGYTFELFGQTVGWEEVAAAARRARRVYLARYDSLGIRLIEAGGVGESAAPGEPLARFGAHLELVDGACTCDQAGRVNLTTSWWTRFKIDSDASIFAHLLDADGTLVAQADGRALLGMLPFWMWEPGETVHDVRHFDAVPSGAYSVRLGVWEPASGKRWSAVGYPDGVVTFTVDCP